MREHLCISPRAKSVAKLEKFIFQPVVIFNHPVVHHGDPLGLVKMRMGILISGRTVRGPARMADPQAALRRLLLQHARQPLVDLPLLLSHHQILGVDHRHTRAVIAAVFQPPQPLQQNGRRRLLTYISDYATHRTTLYNNPPPRGSRQMPPRPPSRPRPRSRPRRPRKYDFGQWTWILFSMSSTLTAIRINILKKSKKKWSNLVKLGQTWSNSSPSKPPARHPPLEIGSWSFSGRLKLFAPGLL